MSGQYAQQPMGAYPNSQMGIQGQQYGQQQNLAYGAGMQQQPIMYRGQLPPIMGQQAMQSQSGMVGQTMQPNATIVTTPSWLFVYETSEGLYHNLHSLKNSIAMCREMYPDEMDDLILLIQSPTASDVIPVAAAKDATEGWRGNHNFREEAFTQSMYNELNGLIDGVIPTFEWTLAKNWMGGTSDGVHQSGEYYKEIFHVQTMAIISAMKSKGWQVPMMAEDDVRVRWFEGVPLE